MKFFSLFLFLFLFTNLSFAEDVMKLNLMPYPAKVSIGSGKFVIDTNFVISIEGNASSNFIAYANRSFARISGRTAVFFSQDLVNKKFPYKSANFIITITRPGKVELNEDESYSLTISPEKVSLKAYTDIGAMRGLETLVQLIQSDNSGYFFPAVNIEDSPRFPWRGLMMDASRHFMPIDVVKRNIDGLAAVKMNVFHWHLSDDQGFRVEMKTLPKLHEIASEGLYYTQDQIKDVIQYAAARGIRVVPEFDVPGHSTSYLTAFPELASAPGPYTIERKWGIFDPTFNPTIEATYEFFDKFFAEISKLFVDPYIHIGGDENNGKQWNENKDIQAFMKKNNIKDNHNLQAYFNQRISKILTKYGKKMVGWDEIQHPDLPKDIVIQSWQGQKGLALAATSGFKVILSNGYYIDLMQPTDFHYLNDPIPANSNLSEEEKKFVLGGEATMWAELVTPENVDSRIWPRTAAIAERFWSPQNVNDVDDMYRRLEIISMLLEDHGLMHIKNQDMMLRRLVKSYNVAPLKPLLNVVEPVKLYSRHSQGVKYTSHSPYTRLVDAATADAKTAREVRKLTDEFLKSKSDESYQKLKDILVPLIDQSSLIKLIDNTPSLKEVKPLVDNLSKLASLGIDALGSIKNNVDFNNDNADDIIKSSKKPYGQVEIMIVSAIEKLVNEAD